MLPLLVAMLTISPAEAKKVQVPGLGLKVSIPEAEDPALPPLWKHSKGDSTSDIRLSLRNATAFTDVAFMATAFQPNLEAVRPALEPYLRRVIDEDLKYESGELRSEDHELLGQVLYLPLTVHDEFMEQDLWSELAVFAVESHGVIAMATSSMSAEMATEQLGAALGLLEVTRAPVALDELPTGRIDAPAGYSLELPTGWRALTPLEARGMSTARIAGEGPYAGQLANMFVVDEASLEGLIFTCEATADVTLEVLDPSKSPLAGENFLTYARVMLRGGRVRISTGIDELFVDSLSELPIHPKDDGALAFIPLQTRDAYLWRVKGTVFEEPAEAAVFYTNWDDVGLSCFAIAEAGEEGRLGTFDQTLRAATVTDGANHPAPLSMKARYVRWWPYGHPALQLYWLPLPLLLIGGVLLFKD
jgi:hypothetical protein